MRHAKHSMQRAPSHSDFLCVSIPCRAQSYAETGTAWDACLSELTCLAYVLNSGDAAYFSATASAAICAALHSLL